MKVADLLRDGVGVAGCGLVSFGAWSIYEPAGFIVAGTLLLAGALFSSAKAR